MSPVYTIGIDLGGTNIKAGLVHRETGLVHQMRCKTDADAGPAHVLSQIRHCVQTLLDYAENGVITGIGIGAPGSINWARTTVHYPPNFPGWTVINLQDELRTHFDEDLIVIVENDANVAGLGSAHYGAGQPFDSFIMVTLGTGVGGAIIYENKIFRGTTGGAGELGHVSIDYEGMPSRAGINGAIEAYLGQRFLSRHARYRLLNRPESLIHEMAEQDLHGITPKMLHEAAQAGDAGAQEVLAWAGHKLGCALGSAVNLLDIRKVVIGGGVAAAGHFLLQPAREALRDFVMPALRDGVELIRETRGNEVSLLGAAHLVFQHLDERAVTLS